MPCPAQLAQPSERRPPPYPTPPPLQLPSTRRALLERTLLLSIAGGALLLRAQGFVSIEEFLVAMEKAGVPCRGLDRKAHDKGSITEDEAMNIVAFFDRDGDGLLSYSEFMSCLQTTKNSVMANKILNTEA